MSPLLFVALCVVPCVACGIVLRMGLRAPRLAPFMRGLVFAGFLLLVAGHLVQAATHVYPDLLIGHGIDTPTATRAMLALPAAGYFLLIVGAGMLSGAARRSETYETASSAIPAVMHRITNLELIYRLLMESSMGATFVLRRTQAGKDGPSAVQLMAGNRAFHEVVALGATRERRGRAVDQQDPDGISWWIEETARKALATKVPVRSERAFTTQGHTRWYLLSVTGSGSYVAGSLVETTQKRRESSEREATANTDPLTKLSNRRHLTTFIDTEAHRASHGVSRGFAVYFFDFDGFKQINDTLGHHVGDELLKQIAARLRESFRHSNLADSIGRPCIARYGGDEYVIVVPGLTQRNEVERLAEHFLGRLRASYTIFEHSVVSTASIGGAVCTGGGVAGHEVLTAADKAMYEAKQSGKDRFQLSDNTAGREELAA